MTHRRNGAYVIWDEFGNRLAELPARSEPETANIVDLAEGRLLLTGTSTVRAKDLSHSIRFEISLGDAFMFDDAVAFKVDPDGAPYLAVIASTPRDVERWRLLVFSPDREVIYEEILNAYPRLFAARRSDGADSLLVHIYRQRLWALRVGP